MAVTVDWIISTLHNQTIQAPPFPPLPKKVTQQTAEDESNRNTDHRRPPETATSKMSVLNSNVFYGDIFTIVRPKPHNGTISFDKIEMESLIANNGGLLLSKHLYEAIKIDVQAATKNNTTISRNFYVVASGGYGDYSKLNPLLADLSKLVQIIPVTSIWIYACIGDQLKYNAQEHPLLFQPQPYPIRLLPRNKFLISLTGFVDASRYGISWMLREIGAQYTDNLKSKNTHLICKEASGKKYEKACEWGMHVVSVEWLYHIVRYGYREGSEEKFSLVKRPKEEIPLPGDGKELAQPNVCAPKDESKVATNTRVDPELPIAEAAPKSFGNDIEDATGVTEKTNEAATRPQITDESKSVSEAAKDLSALKSAEPSINLTRNYGRDNEQITTEDNKSPNEVSKRLHTALESLESSNNNTTFPRRSKRQRQPNKTPEKSPLLLTQHSDEEYPQTEQFTVAVGADADLTFGSHDDSVPQSQMDDAEDNGESQVVWFGNRRGV
jgi:hypothetical protein